MTAPAANLSHAKAATHSASPGKRGLMAVLVLAALLFPLLQVAVGGLNYWLHMGLFIFMNIAIASSWNIIGGYAGYISLGHNVFFAIRKGTVDAVWPIEARGRVD